MHQSYSSMGIYYHVWKQTIWLPLSSPSRKKHMPSPGFEPGSPRPQSKSDDFDRSAMGPGIHYFYFSCSGMPAKTTAWS